MTSTLRNVQQNVKRIFMNVSNNPKNPAFGARVEALMKAHFGDRWGNKTAFAQALGVTNGEITTYLAGTVPYWTRLLKMSDLFGRSIEYLLTGRTASERRLMDLDPDVRHVLLALEQLPPSLQLLLVRVVDVVASQQPDILDILTHTTQTLERILDARAPKR